MLIARDEKTGECPAVPSKDGTFEQENGQEGPFGTLRRSLRQINPFKNRLFRLPATPRLTRTKRVLIGRGEELTGWNFELNFQRPSVERDPNYPRSPLFPNHSPNFPSSTSQLSQKRNSAQTPTIDRQRLRLSALPVQSNNNTQSEVICPELENDDFESFVASIGNISSGFTGGGSCRVRHQKVVTNSWSKAPSQHSSWVHGNTSVAVGRVQNGGGKSRQRLPLPSFEPLPKTQGINKIMPQAPLDAALQSQLFLQQRRRTWYPAPAQLTTQEPRTLHPVSSGPNLFALGYDKCSGQVQGQNHQLLLLPSTSYAPNGDMCAANWRPIAQPHQPPQQHRRPVRPLTMTATSASQVATTTRVPDSPTLSTISLLSTAPPNGLAARSASTNSAAGIRPNRRWTNAITGGDLVYRRSMRLSRRTSDDGSPPPLSASSRSPMATHPEKDPHIELLPTPVPLFTLTDEYPAPGEDENNENVCTCANAKFDVAKADIFFGREWLFDELYRLMAFDRKPFVLLQGAGGTGKSAILRQLARLSLRLKTQKEISTKNNNDTVDSGIVVDDVDDTSPKNSANPRTENFSLNHLQPSLHKLASRVVAFHFCHLYNPASCSIPDFVRNLAAQMCASPLLEDYGRMVRSNVRLHELVAGELANLEIDPLQLFRTLILEPLAETGPPSTKQKRQMAIAKSTKSPSNTADWATATSISLKSDYDSSDETSTNSSSGKGFLLVLVDALDEGSFHRNDGGESIGWLLRQCTPEFPPFLRFICSTTTTASAQAVFGTVSNAISPCSVHLDDPELNRGRSDAQHLAEYLFTSLPDSLAGQALLANSSDSSTDLTEFSSTLVERSRGNPLFIRLFFHLASNAQGSEPMDLPSDLDQLYRIHLNSRFPALSFRSVAPILSILLASLRPLRFEELMGVLNGPVEFGGVEESVSESELHRSLSLLSPIVLKMASGIFVPLNQTFRDLLLKESAEVDPVVDIRYGHILLSLWLVRQNSPFTHERLFELAHHLLKANPHKYMPPEMAPGMPCGKTAQVQWLHRAANDAGPEGENLLRNGLLYRRNIFYPNSKVSRLLLLAGANPNAVWSDTGESILGSFARAGNTEMVELLLQYDADTNFASNFLPCPLILAVQNGNEDVVRILCEHGSSLVDENGTHALVYAAMAESEPVVKFLLDYEKNSAGDLHHCQNGIQKAFEAAAQRGNIHVCRLLSERANSPIEMSAALGCAVQSGASDLVIHLLNNGASDDLNSLSGTEQSSPLMIAARYGHTALIDLLIGKGATVNMTDPRGRTALMHAIEMGRWQSAAFLLDLGSNIRLRDSHSNSLIHLLARNPNKCLINRLLEAGVSLEDKNAEGLRPIEVAIQHGQRMGGTFLAVDTFLRRGARLRSLTWQIARAFNPHSLPVLVQKLLDDAALLLRRRQTNEALHRLDYALQKCNEILSTEGEDEGREESPEIIEIKPRIRQLKGQSLLSIAYLKRRKNELAEALMLATEALHLAADDAEQRFDALFFRSKCFFDVREMDKARIDAKMAAELRPDDANANNLLSILSTPGR